VAGGAVLAGAAGGMALAASRRGHDGGIGAALRKPRIKVDAGDVAKVAKEVGNFSAQVGALAGELQRNREAAGNGKRRSPIEVALQGLTSRGE
jgi:predicted sugar kinase